MHRNSDRMITSGCDTFKLGMAAPLPDKMIPEFKKDLDENFFR